MRWKQVSNLSPWNLIRGHERAPHLRDPPGHHPTSSLVTLTSPSRTSCQRSSPQRASLWSGQVRYRSAGRQDRWDGPGPCCQLPARSPLPAHTAHPCLAHPTAAGDFSLTHDPSPPRPSLPGISCDPRVVLSADLLSKQRPDLRKGEGGPRGA